MSILRKIFLLAVSGLLLLVLGGLAGCSCGDDDDDSGGDDDAGDDDDDSAASGPTVLGTTPDDNDFELKLATIVEITFSEPMDPDSVKNAFVMDDGSKAAVAGSFSWNGTGDVATFTPGADLVEGREYSVSIQTDAQSLAGDSMVSSFSFGFSTVNLWTKRYDGPAHMSDVGTGVVLNSAGDIFATGYVDEYALSDIWIRQNDRDGNELKTIIYDGPANDDDQGQAIALDDQGNIYVGGSEYVVGEVSNIWVCKYDSSWNEVWTETYNGSQNHADSAYGIDVDSAGNVYVVGTERHSTQSQNIWVRKYDPDGNTLWTDIHHGGDGPDWGRGIALDGDSAVYAIGYEYIAGQGGNIWLRKYDPDGGVEWTDTYNGVDNGNDTGYGVAVDSMGNVYAAGFSVEGIEQTNIWLRRYDGEGNVIWTKVFDGGAEGSDLAYGITTDPTGNIYVTGLMTLTGPQLDMWVGKFSPAGDLLWSDSYNDVSNDYDVGYGVGTDAKGNAVVIGQETTPDGEYDIWMRKYDPDGNWAD